MALSIADARRVLLCMGPGGVGKTTVSAALGLAAARAGRRVIVVTIDPSKRLAQALGLDPSLGSTPGSIVPVEPGLDCLLLDTKRVFDDLVQAYSPSPAAARAMLDNPIYQATATNLSGGVEYAATSRVHMLHEEAAYDLIVLDTPPTANAIEFLDAQDRIREVIANPAARFLAGTGRIGMKFLGLGGGVLIRTLESMGGGSFLTQLGVFLRDFSAVLKEFERRAGDVARLVSSEVTGTIITTAPTEFSLREAEGFIDEVLEREMRLDGIVLNRVLTPPPPTVSREQLRDALRRDGEEEDELDARLDALREVEDGARRQAARAEDILAKLSQRHPEIEVVPIARQDPPPTSLEELADMGAVLLPQS